MRIRKIVRGGISALTVAAFAVAMAPGSAQAIAWEGPMEDGARAAAAYFAAPGDHVKVCDTKADGKKARVDVYNQRTGKFLYTLTDKTADGKCSYRDASYGGVYNLPEGESIRFTVWREPGELSDRSNFVFRNDR